MAARDHGNLIKQISVARHRVEWCLFSAFTMLDPSTTIDATLCYQYNV